MLKKWFPSRYLGASDIEEDEVVTIKKIVDEAVGPTQEIKPVLYLHEYEKGIILNVTNATAIAKLYGDNDPYKDWPDKKLALFTETVRNPSTKETGPAIRMKAPPKAKKEAATRTEAALDDEIPFN